MVDNINVGDIYSFTSNYDGAAADGRAYWICTALELKSNGNGVIYYGFTNEAINNNYLVPVVAHEAARFTNTIKFSMDTINFANFSELDTPKYYNKASDIDLDEINDMLLRRIYETNHSDAKERGKVFFDGSVASSIEDSTILVIIRNNEVNNYDGFVITSDDIMEPFYNESYNMDKFKLIGMVPYNTYLRLLKVHQLRITLYKDDKYWNPVN